MTEQVARHYANGGSLDRIRAVLVPAARKLDHPTINDVATADEFHPSQRLATEALAIAAVVEGRIPLINASLVKR